MMPFALVLASDQKFLATRCAYGKQNYSDKCHVPKNSTHVQTGCSSGVFLAWVRRGYSSKYQNLLPLTDRDSPEQIGIHAAITAGADDLAVNHIKKLYPPGPGERGTRTVSAMVSYKSTYTTQDVETFHNCALNSQ